ncbi:hypothetical protein V6Z11_A11G240400 [Gossypium hirsutum]
MTVRESPSTSRFCTFRSKHNLNASTQSLASAAKGEEILSCKHQSLLLCTPISGISTGLLFQLSEQVLRESADQRLRVCLNEIRSFKEDQRGVLRESVDSFTMR